MSDRISDVETRIAEIEARLNAATPGPWCHDPKLTNYRREPHAGGIYTPGHWAIAKIEDDGDRPEADAALIANAPSDLAWLLAELRRERERLDYIEADAERLTLSTGKQCIGWISRGMPKGSTLREAIDSARTTTTRNAPLSDSENAPGARIPTQP